LHETVIHSNASIAASTNLSYSHTHMRSYAYLSAYSQN